jgi:hypothetical protein
MQIIVYAAEERVWRHLHRNLEIARQCAPTPRMPLARDTNPGSIRDAGGNADEDALDLRFDTLSPARRTSQLLLPSRPPTLGTGLRKHHVPSCRPKRPGTMTLAAPRLGCPEGTTAAARVTNFVARYRNATFGSAKGFIEGEGD